ncbi:hypothetical protein CHS0354_033180 [Potamilus streckersoni]|uniref:Annexin n=1 Tax=Potamilus streckersoni TaxID=2493646 RepID=A0AAE0S6S2_9BIVA|nr:hypothetical protein CHS0354_033180 [Potamilus streckersoni]
MYGGGYGMGYGGYGTGYPGQQYPGYSYSPYGGGAYNVNPGMMMPQQMQMPMQPMQMNQMPMSCVVNVVNNYSWNSGAMIEQLAKALHPEEEEEEEEEEEPEEDVEDEEGDEEVQHVKKKEKKRAKKGAKKAQKVAEKAQNDAQYRETLRQRFIDMCFDHYQKYGTLDPTEGTIKPYTKYLADDPVVAYMQKQDGYDITGEKWDPEHDTRYLNDAIKGLGTDEDAITYTISTRSNTQRQELKKMFKTQFGRDLIEELSGDLSGDYRKCVTALFVPPAEFDAYCIKDAIYGAGTNEDKLIEILLTRTNAQIQEIRKVYPDVVCEGQKVPENQIEKDIEDDTSGDFKRILIACCQGNRKTLSRADIENAVEDTLDAEGNPTGLPQINEAKLVKMDRCKREAQKLFDSGEKAWGTGEEEFTRIFCVRDFPSLRVIYDQYVKLSQRDIINSVERETSGNYQKALLTLAMCVKSQPLYFATLIRSFMKGLGTRDVDLIRAIITRSEIDMVQIKKAFLGLTNQTLWKWLEGDCSGDYKRLLQAVVGRD